MKKYGNNIIQFWHNITNKIWRRETNVYFVSGMCYNCKVFDNITLPEGFNKIYIEWLIPQKDETLSDYSKRMIAPINTKRPFVLVGYSFGAIILYEMNRYVKPQKNIIISSFKREDETPTLFRLAKSINFAERIPEKAYSATQFITNIFNRLVYTLPTSSLDEYMTQTDPVYIKWSIHQITNWQPHFLLPNVYHIHGTKDQIFSFKTIKDAIEIKDGDHLMVFKKHKEISENLSQILSDG
ncbi:alpha/beta hydrolase [Dysgonomonas sp. 520]|uniref:alpha/beta hydrolase n=1 Tax=Dysgonomonas sp. 520 TaxID=2302931 RepID=UPI0013D3B6D9|nr:alpha/beta hydrolase [Dysgonomonas sp. 520]NDW11086.1 alpha/beta hydrolase [Dysgonomonas sp. 520]